MQVTGWTALSVCLLSWAFGLGMGMPGAPDKTALAQLPWLQDGRWWGARGGPVPCLAETRVLYGISRTHMLTEPGVSSQFRQPHPSVSPM